MILLLPLGLIISCLTFCNAIDSPCPPKILVRPCICTSTNVDSSLTCNNIERQTDLDGMLHRTGKYQFDNLEITNSHISSLPGRSLEIKQFGSLKISHSKLDSLFYHKPGQSNDLEIVTFQDVTFKDGLKWNQFENLKKVKKISIKDVELPELDESFRDNISKKLTSIALKRTNTSKLNDLVFTQNPDLEDVRIQKNAIFELKRSMFSTKSKIETFLFDDNLIETIPKDLFKNMPKLVMIGLRNNKISKISENTFGDVYNNLIALVLEGNPINCDCSMKWITSRDTRKKYVTGACAQPKNLAGKDIADLTPGHFTHCS